MRQNRTPPAVCAPQPHSYKRLSCSSAAAAVLPPFVGFSEITRHHQHHRDHHRVGQPLPRWCQFPAYSAVGVHYVPGNGWELVIGLSTSCWGYVAGCTPGVAVRCRAGTASRYVGCVGGVVESKSARRLSALVVLASNVVLMCEVIWYGNIDIALLISPWLLFIDSSREAITLCCCRSYRSSLTKLLHVSRSLWSSCVNCPIWVVCIF